MHVGRAPRFSEHGLAFASSLAFAPVLAVASACVVGAAACGGAPPKERAMPAAIVTVPTGSSARAITIADAGPPPEPVVPPRLSLSATNVGARAPPRFDAMSGASCVNAAGEYLEDLDAAYSADAMTDFALCRARGTGHATFELRIEEDGATLLGVQDRGTLGPGASECVLAALAKERWHTESGPRIFSCYVTVR